MVTDVATRRGRPRDRDTDRRLVEALWAVAGEPGAERIAPGRVVRRAGTSWHAFHRRYGAVEELVEVALAAMPDPGPAPVEPGIDDLAAALADDHATLRDPAVRPLLRHALFSGDPRLEAALEEHVLGPRRRRAAAIAEACAAGARGDGHRARRRAERVFDAVCADALLGTRARDGWPERHAGDQLTALLAPLGG